MVTISSPGGNIDVSHLLAALRSIKLGDFSTRLGLDQTGAAGELATAFNEVASLLEQSVKDVETLKNALGTEGKTAHRLPRGGHTGSWATWVDSVNSLVDELVYPTAEVARVVGAVARGDLSLRMAVEHEGRSLDGDFLSIGKTVNTMVDQLGSFASEVTRVVREVGIEGKLGGQATVPGVAGIWKDLTDNVNSMTGNLTSQLRNIAAMTTAVAAGDLSKRITVDAKGEILELKDTINTMVDQLGSFASEVTRVAREVGTEGRLGGQAEVKGVAGTWKHLTDNVNMMAANLTGQVRNIAEVTTAVANGNLSKKITVDVKGELLELKDTINTMVDQLSSFASEVTRVAREVGTEGRLGGQASVPGVAGTWKDLTDNVNFMAGNLTGQVRNIADVTTAVANGDLSKKITVDVKGEILELKDTINTMVDQLSSFAAEVTRVAREVGTEGKLGGQASVPGVAGTWKDLTDSVNSMAANLTGQVRNIAEVTTAVAGGELSKKITVDVKGEILELKNTINTMVDQLGSFAAEVTRVAREVGTEGRLGGQAAVPGVAGTWKDLTDNVNMMAANLTGQVRNIAEVTTAVARGDLSKKITVNVRGEILELKDTINTMVDQLSSFASEVTRVAREVGTEGNLGGQAVVEGVAGTWRDLTDSVNSMAANLTGQVRNIAEVTTAVANGNLSKKITVHVRGEILELKETINTMVDQLGAFASEVTRVAREVGTEGNLGGQAIVPGVAGTWKDLTDSVNSMAANLTGQVRNIAEVTTAVALGDLSKKITVDVKGEILELKDTINTMVDQLGSFAAEVTRVAREVGTQGELGGQAEVEGVAGIWKDLTDNVNLMGDNLTAQVRNIAEVTTAVANGDLSKKITVDVRGEILELKQTINTMVDQLSSFASEVTRVAREVGTDGKLGGQAVVKEVAGIWKDLTDSVNSMADNLTTQVRNIAEVTTAVANGDLSKKITVGAKGEIQELKSTINTMVDQLSSFASEVTRVAREVGTEGQLGGQAIVKGVAGIWKDLTDNVNIMAANLTSQVRGIAKVVTAVAGGDLKQKLLVESKGEIAALTETINEMSDTLATFAAQVTTVAREVGFEGKLGGQAKVPGATGTWRDLTDNVNQLAANLTTQVRAIAEVARAVTKGDLTQSIRVEALGEVAALKDSINEMIGNLRETTRKNTEQDWLKTNLARFTRMLQGQKDLLTVARTILSELAPVVSVRHGVFYIMDRAPDAPVLKLLSGYAFKKRKSLANQFHLGEGLIGQAALEKERILLTEVPDDYVRINSGLGEAPPRDIVVLPVMFEDEVMAVVELASFNRFNDIQLTFLDQLAEGIGIVLNTLAASMRTEALLKQSQSLAEELQSQQEELRDTNARLEEQAATLRESEELLKSQREQLQQTNEELEEKAELLSNQKTEVEAKNEEIELARRALQEKAEQLQLTSKYKSEFLANMSHELRTPLNSLLILAELLAGNPDENLTSKQIDFARNIYSSGSDLLALINDILDMSKVESGAVSMEVTEKPFGEICDYLERTFRQVAQDKGLGFMMKLAPNLPPAISTDVQRLQQVLKNLLSNAFKFTAHGQVQLDIQVARFGWSPDHESLNRAGQVIAFAVTDTGIGIPADKLRVIFEPFQQADMSTSREYGGTGLGLSISREIARLLGGEIRVLSTPGKGSTFTLYVPRDSSLVHGAPRQRSASAGATTALGEGQPPAPPREASSGDASQRGRQAQSARDIQSTPGTRLGPWKQPANEPRPNRPEAMASAATDQEEDDDRHIIQPKDRVLLIVEDDRKFAQILLEMARERSFKGVIAPNGEEGLAMAHRLSPDAVILDIQLPDMKGWAVLDRLKHDPRTRHIPVEIMSIADEVNRGLKLGALACIPKPVSKDALAEALGGIHAFLDRQVKKLLVVEDDQSQWEPIRELVGDGDVQMTAVATAAEALAELRAAPFDCMVLDLVLPDMSGLDLLQVIRREPALRELPVVVYTGKDLTKEESAKLNDLARGVIIKDAESPARLLDQTALFLHRVEANLPEFKKRMLAQVHETDHIMAGKKVLIVDDDLRNIYALTAVLERHTMQVVYAENGREALDVLSHTPDVDLVLMDIMMPLMDGYEAMRSIRRIESFRSLPIIALTAKAMKGDRDKCIEAGASDYIAKPVNSERLLALLRVWLYR